MNKNKAFLFFMVGLAAALSLSALLTSPLAARGTDARPESVSTGYSVDWYTIDGGSGSGEGGRYSLNYTIGQVDAGWSGGSGFSVYAGFWGGITQFWRNFLSAVQK